MLNRIHKSAAVFFAILVLVSARSRAESPLDLNRFAVNVIDAQSKRPLSGAKAVIRYEKNESHTACTKDDGTCTFFLRNDAVFPSVHLRVSLDGYLSLHTQWYTHESVPASYTAALEKGIPVSGTVLDDTGKPIEDALVTIENVDPAPYSSDQEMPRVEFEKMTARTDARGRWKSLGGKGKVTVSVKALGFETVSQEIETNKQRHSISLIFDDAPDEPAAQEQQKQLSGAEGRDTVSVSKPAYGAVKHGMYANMPDGEDTRWAKTEEKPPNGKILQLGIAQAEVVIARPGWWLTYRNGTVQDAVDHRHPTKAGVLKSDTDGRVVLPDIQGPFVLVITHSSGYALLDGESIGADVITLTPWASIEGELRLSGIACPDMGIEADCYERIFDKDGHAQNSSFDDAEAIRIGFKADTKTNGEARFLLSQLAEGKASVRPLQKDPAGLDNPIYGLGTETAVVAGKTTTLNPGDARYRVVGKLVARKGDPPLDWKFVKAELHLNLPSFSMSFDDGGIWRGMAKAQDTFEKSDKGRLYSRAVPVSEDGTFHIDDVPDGYFRFCAWMPSDALGWTDAKSKSAGMAAYSFVLPISSPQPGSTPSAAGSTIDLEEIVLAITESASR